VNLTAAAFENFKLDGVSHYAIITFQNADSWHIFIDFVGWIEILWTGTNEGHAGGAFIDEVSFVLGFVQVGEAETVMSSVVKLSEDSAEKARMLEKLIEGTQISLNSTG